MKKFTQSRRGQFGKSKNEFGKVVVKIILQDPDRPSGYPVKGNITKTFTVKDADVLDVHKAIIEALFEEQ